MAGYIFTVSKEGWDAFCENDLRGGFFTPFTIPVTAQDMKPTTRKSRNKILAATFGDMVTMKPGDNVYFLSNRKIYGIGTTVQIGPDCKYDNYSSSSALFPDCQINPNDYLTTENTRARWVCLFAPTPFFFKKGADMDDVLRFRPQAFRSLRAFEGLSFIKIDDDENRALKEYISLVNEPSYSNIDASVFLFDPSVHDRLRDMDLDPYIMDISKSLVDEENREYVISEMLIESILLQKLSRDESEVFGKWDYLTHQLIASPFKPLKYIDRIDVFGYRFSARYNDSPKLVTKYLLVELKKDAINRAALEQTMQYVDWICTEYASGDYSKIEAYVVGSRTTRGIADAVQEICQRSFILETHPVVSGKWNDLNIVCYSLDGGASFNKVEL